MKFDRKIYFDCVRKPIFGGGMTQGQVDGQEFLLAKCEGEPEDDLRCFAYMLATTFHETAATMQPIEEYGHGDGHEYGDPDPETGQCYYGRGYVQLTWKDNYSRATTNLGMEGDDDLVWHPDRALDPKIASQVMFNGMHDGWFTGKKLPDYFNETRDDPIGARAIINPDDKGAMVAGYHADFLVALTLSSETEPSAEPLPLEITIISPVPLNVTVKIGSVLAEGAGFEPAKD
jgi:putative chitinase